MHLANYERMNTTFSQALVCGTVIAVTMTLHGCDTKRLVRERHVAQGDPPGPFEVGGMMGETTTARSAVVNGAKADTERSMRARVQMKPTEGHNVQGTLELAVAMGRVHIRGELTGFEGAGEHGFHVHEVGDCGAPDAKSAGNHFSAMPHPHGAPGSETAAHHTGDLGNITSDASGKAQVDASTEVPLLTPGPEYAVGRALIVHASRDDLASQPAGNAGARVACGVIEAQNP